MKIAEPSSLPIFDPSSVKRDHPSSSFPTLMSTTFPLGSSPASFISMMKPPSLVVPP
ncbi:hypothetical protein BC939DRAFT_439819 [Gamsiella multidivaricata]|uniref:uncharacterized protein n=1 Tax=Gamsiella multidivaricata TaxID=101098 RepID=UPI002220167C|nr:uncharacterized protein BC939DRAFT_439819 [Gamsiella multidivaricata]KAI7830197.1 hypothetical protein BC939DRAFT_439819 [Gamsiella multidivaricata]